MVQTVPFSQIPSDCFHLIFKCYLNNRQSIAAIAATCKDAQSKSKLALGYCIAEVTELDYQQLKTLYLASKKWFPDQKIRSEADVILRMPLLARLDLSGISRENYEAQRYKALKGVFMCKIAGAENLREIALNNLELQWPGSDFMSAIKAFPKNLSRLEVSFSLPGSPKVVEYIGKKAPALTFLKLPSIREDNTYDATFEKFTKECRGLTTLEFSNFNCTEAQVKSLSNLSHLIHIKAGELSYDSMETLLMKLPESVPQLQSLDLSYAFSTSLDETDLVEPAWMLQILQGCKELRELRLAYARVDKAIFDRIAAYGEKLRILDLTGVEHVSPDEVGKILLGCKNIETLLLDGTPIKIKRKYAIEYPLSKIAKILEKVDNVCLNSANCFLSTKV